MKANKVYLSRLKRGFKDKEVVPVGCTCEYFEAPDLGIKIKMKDCELHN